MKLNEDDLNLVAKKLFIISGYRLFPWDWTVLGTENQNKYRIWAIESGFTDVEWDKLSKEQKKLVVNYLNTSVTNPRYFTGNLSFWS
ncbi:MAG: hypothetical protein FWG33_04330, partial [Oscillospiraceae bacterium]|nr:hypothetical protein [Oscillospiraceae bacterium]